MHVSAPAATLVCCGLIGTIVADDGLVERAFTEAIATQGIVPGTSAFARCMAQVHRNRGQRAGDVMSGLFPENHARGQAAQLAFERSFGAAVDRMGVSAVPGATQCVAELASAGVRVCVVSDLASRSLKLVLDAIGWRPLIDLALSADEVDRGSPMPDLLLSVMLRQKITDVRELVLADCTGDGVLAARRAGAGVVVGVLTGPHSAERLRQAGATQVIDSIAELSEIAISRRDAGWPAATTAPATGQLAVPAPGASLPGMPSGSGSLPGIVEAPHPGL